MLVVRIKDKDTGVEKDVQISKTLGGDYLMKEHPEVNIVIIPSKQKFIVLPKDRQNQYVYNLQEKIMKFMADRGVISHDAISGGNIFGAIQATYPQQAPGGEDPLQVVIYNLADFIEQERPSIAYAKAYEDEMEKQLLAPDVEATTELGEVPQEPFKGSIPKYGFPTRGVYRYNY